MFYCSREVYVYNDLRVQPFSSSIFLRTHVDKWEDIVESLAEPVDAALAEHAVLHVTVLPLNLSAEEPHDRVRHIHKILEWSDFLLGKLQDAADKIQK